jgi:hypothetical protein
MMAGLKARLFGLLLVGIGVALAWFFGLRPLEAARSGAQHIDFPIKLFIAAPMAIVFGLVMLVGGPRVAAAVSGPPRTREQHLIVWPLFAVALAAGGLGYWWYDAQLHALGYVSG